MPGPDLGGIQEEAGDAPSPPLELDEEVADHGAPLRDEDGECRRVKKLDGHEANTLADVSNEDGRKGIVETLF